MVKRKVVLLDIERSHNSHKGPRVNLFLKHQVVLISKLGARFDFFMNVSV